MAFPLTDPGLPARLADRGDAAAWDRFVAVYRPAVVVLARKRGLSTADADDVAQEVCRSVAEAVGRFEEGRGRARFSTWLVTIAERKSIDALRRRRVRPMSAPAFDTLPARDTDSRLLRLEVRRRLFQSAADDVREEVSPTAWEAFWRTAIDGEPAERVATALGLSAGAIYAAKARTMRKLVERIGSLEAEWSTDGTASGPPGTGAP
ncbi:MAG: RNA polymerase sigma factor [Planctomycetaceae bacterium]